MGETDDPGNAGRQGMSTTTLRPWTDVVKLHPDVESGALTEAVFAIDLGAIAMGDPGVPAVYRDPELFFQATYLTADLRRLLEEVLASLAGSSSYNRVLKLRTPFGGGKSHTLAALLHAARKREALDLLPEAEGLARPKDVAVAVFDGEKFDARDGKETGDGRMIRTMWGCWRRSTSWRRAWTSCASRSRATRCCRCCNGGCWARRRTAGQPRRWRKRIRK